MPKNAFFLKFVFRAVLGGSDDVQIQKEYPGIIK